MYGVSVDEPASQNPLHFVLGQIFRERVSEFVFVDVLLDHVDQHGVGPVVEIRRRQIAGNIDAEFVRPEIRDRVIQPNDSFGFVRLRRSGVSGV